MVFTFFGFVVCFFFSSLFFQRSRNHFPLKEGNFRGMCLICICLSEKKEITANLPL